MGEPPFLGFSGPECPLRNRNLPTLQADTPFAHAIPLVLASGSALYLENNRGTQVLPFGRSNRMLEPAMEVPV